MENDAGIHPAPDNFSAAEIAQDPILHFFHFAHLPPQLRETSRRFCYLARYIISDLPRNAERTVALRKLLEAKDAAVRANLPAPTIGGMVSRETAKAVMPEFNEPVGIGGHDEDRDGPIPFSG